MVETFDASLLQSDPVKILSFVDFSLSTPAQRAQRNGAQAHPENANENIKDDDRIPFISANGAPGPREGALGALANVGAAESQGDAPASDADVAGDETAGEEADEEIVITALTLTLALLEGEHLYYDQRHCDKAADVATFAVYRPSRPLYGQCVPTQSHRSEA